MLDGVETGLIVSVADFGTVVQVAVETSDGLVALAADGNLWRRAAADCGSLRGRAVRFGRTDWGGLAWFALDSGEGE